MDQRHFSESIGMNHGTYGGHEKRASVPRGARLIANSIELRWRVPAMWLLTGTAPDRPATGQDDAAKTIRSRLATVHPIRPGMTDVAFERLLLPMAG